LLEYFPGQQIDEQETSDDGPSNHWTVINCHIDKLEEELRRLPPGPKQLAVCRYEDQVTVVVNQLDNPA
jgi:hypothetical protein